MSSARLSDVYDVEKGVFRSPDSGAGNLLAFVRA